MFDIRNNAVRKFNYSDLEILPAYILQQKYNTKYKMTSYKDYPKLVWNSKDLNKI